METERRRRTAFFVLVAILILLALLFFRCRAKPETPELAPAPAAATPAESRPATAERVPAAAESDEVLTPATLQGPQQVLAGARFSVSWTGPDNRGDHVIVARADAPAGTAGSYRETKEGATLELTAPIEPGAYEVRYVTGRSRTVLARTPLAVVAAEATLAAPDEVVLGARVDIAWTGPANVGDYVTIVPAGSADEVYGDYAETKRGSPLTVTAPTTAGDAEIRYVSGQGRKVLARRALRIAMPEVSLSAPDEAVAGATIQVAWTGPNNAGDYVTVVAAGTPDGQYGNYFETRVGSPSALLLPVLAGDAELRYATGQGNRVLARRPLRLVAPVVTLSAPDEAAAGSEVPIEWTGPAYAGDYMTIVPAGKPDEHYEKYADASAGSPLTVVAPAEPGAAEIRYVAGQGRKVLARRPIRITR